MIESKKEYNTKYNERDFTTLMPTKEGRINLYLKADLKKKIQEHCQSIDTPMTTFITMLVNKYFYDIWLYENKEKL